MEQRQPVFAEQGSLNTGQLFRQTGNQVNTWDTMGLNTIIAVNSSQDHLVNTLGIVNTSLYGEDQSVQIELDYWVLPIFIVFITTGVFGNFLVCLAISTNRELQNMTNYFLMSLAVADLLVCLIVMPFGAIVFFSGSWPLSEGWCVFYQTCDVLACSASILHLMFISVGRYRGIRRPLRQRAESESSVLYRVVLTWGLGMLLASPIPVLALIDIHNIMPAPNICEMNNEYFLIFGGILSFYIPMVIMVTTYILTIHHLKKQKLCALAGSRHILSKNGTGLSKLSSKETGTYSASSRATITTSYTHVRNGHNNSFSSIAGTESAHRCCRLMLSRGTQTPVNISHEIQQNSRKKSFSRLPFSSSFRQMSSTVSEEKASRVLGVVFSTFVICWAPFFIMNLVVVACGQVCAPPAFLGDMALWLGYASSTINPLIYTVFNIKFRRSFGKLLLCRVRSLRNGHMNTSL
eukprot:GFUD01034394.1.p1 GENE.GFUD01034394.1~~GFUD01034394.1.p1  ORF type:complete len:463 (-),score=82.11 GFUD01034394.1:47-1435(-)